MSNAEMPIFTRTFDFLTWLLPATNNFPRAHRHTFSRRLLDAAFDLRECLEAANIRQGRERLARLRAADESLDRVRLYVRLAARWGWLSSGQYRHVAEMVAEIGRLLGGWKKVTLPGTG
ncbi:MAG: diversity-generating retroelement protein Avd [Deltaproteobacteria bacterium]|nr:diversity-generating retroelement protein Avd [Deltaproteobacteria bacterium]